MGATGSGKSTLIKLLLRFQDPAEGRVLIDDQPIETLTLSSLREAIGLVSQDVYLFEGTVRDNIAYGRPEADENEVIEAARTAEAWGFIQTLPQGLDTPVGERGVRLSGGQRQRLSLLGPCSRIRRSWCWTRRPAPWTTRPRRPSSARWRGSAMAAR